MPRGDGKSMAHAKQVLESLILEKAIDKSFTDDYGCEITYRTFEDGHIEVVNVKYLPTKRELEKGEKK